MATYSDKVKESFETKLKIFLFTKAFEIHILKYIKNAEDIQNDFNNFNLTLDIAKVYSSQYYQFDSNETIVLPNGISALSSKIVANLMDETKYIISSNNLKSYLGEIYDILKKQYEESKTVLLKQDFNNLIKEESCSYCGITLEQIAQLGKNKQLNNKRSETRGYVLEIDRKEPNLEYTKDNCCMTCYWCNNAKTDEFTVNEFKEIAQGINAIWKKRGAKIDGFKIIDFDKIEFWKTV